VALATEHPMRPVPILHLIHNLRLEGAQVMLGTLARHTDCSRFRQIVCAWRTGGPIAAVLDDAGIETWIAPGEGRAWQTLRVLLQSMRRADVALLHAHLSDSAILAAVLRAWTGVPLLITHHSNRLVPQLGLVRTPVRRRMLRWAGTHAGANIAVTAQVSDRLAGELGLASSSIEVIHNGIALPDAVTLERTIRARRERQRSGATDWPHIVSVGRLIPIKGHAQLIAALPHIIREWPGVHVSIVGDGECRKELTAQAAALGVRERVTFTGARNDIERFYEAADVYVSTSHYEGLPMAVMEAMGWAIPVLASNVAGNNDLVRDNETGLLFPLHDIRTLAVGLVRFAGDPALVARLTRKARNIVVERYSAAAMADQYEAVYTRIIGR
jgi:L-malate glycosyltransferase